MENIWLYVAVGIVVFALFEGLLVYGKAYIRPLQNIL